MVLPYSPRLDARHGGRSVAQLIVRLAATHRIGVLHLRRASEESACSRIIDACDFVEEVHKADATATRARVDRAVGLVRGRPMQVSDFASAELAARLDGIVKRWRPDVVHVELEAMARHLRDVDARRLLVVVEPAAATADEVWRQSRGFERLVRRLDSRAWRRYERTLAGSADTVVALTDEDAARVRALAADGDVRTIPLGTEIPPEPLDPLGLSPPSVVFVGGFGHEPNVAAARRLATRILPRVLERRPETRLFLVGDRPPPELRALAGETVVVTGRVPAVDQFVNDAAVVAAPLDVGGGMRLKVLETLAAGKALVATPRAVAGLRLSDGEHVLIADDDAAFAAALLRLLGDPEERRRLAAAARDWATQHLDPSVSAAAYAQLYEELAAGTASRF
jgi:glycosyltransferase involved in cell wall biosynthesis